MKLIYFFTKVFHPPMRKKIKHKIPEAHQTATSPPSITSVLGYPKDEFDVDNINNDNDSDQDFDASDLDHDLKPPIRCPCTLNRKEILILNMSTAEPHVSTALNPITSGNSSHQE
jgi:hypothetical protein